MWKKALFASCTLCAIAPAQLAFAQTTTGEAPARAPAATESAAETDAVIVTALKRAQNIQDVPLSINVISADQLEEYNKSDIRGIQGSVPGLFVQTSPTNQGLYLRGFGSAPTNPAFDQSVSLFQDGMYLGRSRQFMAPFFDVERIEVLRGPQGALVGRNTAAGAISIITASPTDTFEGAANVNYNFSREGYGASGYVSGPISDTLSARLALRYEDIDGYLKNLATGTDDPSKKSIFGRVSLAWEPSESFDATAKFEFASTRVNGTHTVNVPRNAPFTLTDVKNGARPFGAEERDDQDGYNSTITMNWDLGAYTLTSITGFSYFASDTLSGAAALNPENYYVAWYEKFNQQSQEVRLLSPEGKRFDFVVGAYYDQSGNSIFQTARYNVIGRNGAANINFHQNSRSYSLFAQGTWRVTDDVRVLGSARQTWIDKTGRSTRTLAFGTALSGVFGPIGPVEINEELFDPSVTVQYDLTDDVMVYLSFGRGSKGGGFDSANASTTTANFAFKAEESQNIEIGEKGTFFNGALVLNVSAFRLKFENLQVASFVPPLGLQTSNAAGATSKGAEFTATLRPTDRLTFSASGAYIDATYDDFPGAPCRGTQAPSVCSSTAPIGAPNNQANNNNRGIQLPFVPEWSGELRAEYAHPIGDMTLTVSGAANHRSEVWIDSSYNPGFGQQPAVTKFDARIALTGPADRWSLALIGTNLTEEWSAGQSFAWPLETGPGGTPVAGIFLDEGRVVQLQAGVRF